MGGLEGPLRAVLLSLPVLRGLGRLGCNGSVWDWCPPQGQGGRAARRARGVAGIAHPDPKLHVGG